MPRALRLAPVSIRLSHQERATLLSRAGSVGLSTYIKSVVLADGRATTYRKHKSADSVLLAQILGQLGASGLSQSMKALAEAADSGSLDLDDLTISQLHTACGELSAMRCTLLQALGKKVPDSSVVSPVRRHFSQAASGDMESQS